MNAAFLLVTACFAGDTAAAMPPPVASACCGTTSCDTCGSGGHKLLARLHGMFKHNSCDTCAAPKCPAPPPPPRCAPVCAPACAPACDTCGHSGPKLLERLRACFHHDRADCGCSTCGSGTVGAGVTVIPKTGEPIQTAPKKMPSVPSKEPPTKQIRIDTPPIQGAVPPTVEVVPNAGQVPPAIVPGIEADNLRNPF